MKIWHRNNTDEDGWGTIGLALLMAATLLASGTPQVPSLAADDGEATCQATPAPGCYTAAKAYLRSSDQLDGWPQCPSI